MITTSKIICDYIQRHGEVIIVNSTLQPFENEYEGYWASDTGLVLRAKINSAYKEIQIKYFPEPDSNLQRWYKPSTNNEGYTYPGYWMVDNVPTNDIEKFLTTK